jgi:Glycosyltransferase family 9 (heptosyltransferase)
VSVLIAKLGATGDVVRTTPLIKELKSHIVWLTARKNAILVNGLAPDLRCFSWEERAGVPDIEYDLIINLEDTLDVASYLNGFKSRQLFGAYVDSNNALRYTDDSKSWFDLSLISRYGRKEADRLKLLNRRTYQDLIFSGLGFRFNGQPYVLPEPIETGLVGDIAISAEAGPVWPMKNWAFYAELKTELQSRGFKVNVLGKRPSLLEHLADVRNHRCFVGGDSLPMHLALGTGTPCVSIFTCTSPWEIYDYGVQTKIVSPLLEEYFYQRGYDRRATTAIGLGEVVEIVVNHLKTPSRVASQIARK